MRRIAIPCAIALSVLAGAARAEQEPLAAVVRVAVPGDEELLSRVRGQTVDLNVAVTVERGPLEPDLGAQLEAAGALAARRGARVVVWFRRGAGELEVLVAEPGQGRVLLRRIESDGGVTERSAAAEAAALVVRSALRALAAGGTIGVEPATLAPAPAPPPPVPASPAPPPPPEIRWAWLAAVGWQGVADGASPRGQHALAVRLGARRGRLVAALDASAGLPATLRDELTAVELARHTLGVAVGYELSASPRLRLTAEAAVGVAGYVRSTVALVPEVSPTPSRTTPALVGGPGLRLGWRPHPGALVPWIQVVVAADVVAGAPELGYQVGDGFVPRDRLWPVQPRVGIGVIVVTD